MDDRNVILNILSKRLRKSTSVNPPSTSTILTFLHQIKAVFDSGASSHYLRPCDTEVASDIKSYDGPIVTLPDSSKMKATKTAQLPLAKELSPKAQLSHILPSLKSSTLISVGQLCDDGCDVLFGQNDVKVYKNEGKISHLLQNEEPILRGTRNFENRLWDTPLIPREKRKIQDNNVRFPATRAAIYPA